MTEKLKEAGEILANIDSDTKGHLFGENQGCQGKIKGRVQGSPAGLDIDGELLTLLSQGVARGRE